jgi:hypothetical protein
MESEGLLPCSQEPATCPYPEPNESNPYLLWLFLVDFTTWLFFLCENEVVVWCFLNLTMFSNVEEQESKRQILHRFSF